MNQVRENAKDFPCAASPQDPECEASASVRVTPILQSFTVSLVATRIQRNYHEREERGCFEGVAA